MGSVGYVETVNAIDLNVEDTITDVLSGKTYRGEELRRGIRLALVGGGDQAQLLYFKQNTI